MVSAMPNLDDGDGKSRGMEGDPSGLTSVLLIAEAPDMVRLIGDYLRFKGCHITMADDVEQALSLLRTITPTVLVFDAPDVDDLAAEAIQHLRDAGAALPLVVLTNRPVDELPASWGNGYAHFSKPIRLAQLAMMIEGVAQREAA
jgi:DNA-binding response OmpR family regulator